jgi:hypothetical protein
MSALLSSGADCEGTNMVAFLVDPAELGRDPADDILDLRVEPADVGLELIPLPKFFLSRAESKPARAELGLELVRADVGKDGISLALSGASLPTTPDESLLGSVIQVAV